MRALIKDLSSIFVLFICINLIKLSQLISSRFGQLTCVDTGEAVKRSLENTFSLKRTDLSKTLPSRTRAPFENAF